MRENDPEILVALQAVNNAAALIVDEHIKRQAQYTINALSKSMK